MGNQPKANETVNDVNKRKQQTNRDYTVYKCYCYIITPYMVNVIVLYVVPRAPETADHGTDEKAAVFGNRQYWESYITYKTLIWGLEMGGGIGGRRYWEGRYQGLYVLPRGPERVTPANNNYNTACTI